MTKYIPDYSFHVGKTIIKYTPSGMWGHYVWQNTDEFICSGIKREKDKNNTIRFTQIGDGSIWLPGEGYADIEFKLDDINETNISKVMYSHDKYEIKVIGGWIEFKDNYNKKLFRERISND